MSETPEVGKLDYNSPESWSAARKYAGLFGAIPSSFTSTIRTLQNDAQNDGQLSHGGQFSAMRLLRSESMKSPFYFSVLRFKGEAISGKKYVSPRDLAKVYPPRDLAGLIAIIFLYRKAKSICSDDLWAEISGMIGSYTDISVCTGTAIPNIGIFQALLVNSLPRIALAAFAKHDADGFRGYLKRIQTSNGELNAEFEMTRWGCTSHQLAAALIQSAGLGIDLANSYVLALSGTADTPIPSPKEQKALRLAALWAESLNSSGKIPDITHDGDFYPSEAARETLLSRISEIRESDSYKSWIAKTKEDIDTEKTPVLFRADSKPEAETTESTEKKVYTIDDLPEDIRSELTDGQLEDLTSEEIEELLSEL